MWKVKRIHTTPFLFRIGDGANRLRVCCLLFTVPYGREEQTTHTVSSSGYRLICGNAAKNNRHLWGVAVAFFAFCGLAFREVFRTMTVTVHFFM
jgi:hypothetical protein